MTARSSSPARLSRTRGLAGAKNSGLSFSTTSAFSFPFESIPSKVRPAAAGTGAPQNCSTALRAASSAAGRYPGRYSPVAPTSRIPQTFASCGSTNSERAASCPRAAIATFAAAAVIAPACSAPRWGRAYTTERGRHASSSRAAASSERGSASATPAGGPLAPQGVRQGGDDRRLLARARLEPDVREVAHLAAAGADHDQAGAVVDDGVLAAQGGDVVAGLQVVRDHQQRLRARELRHVGGQHFAAEGAGAATRRRRGRPARRWSRRSPCRRRRGRASGAGSSPRWWRAASRGSRSPAGRASRGPRPGAPP